MLVRDYFGLGLQFLFSRNVTSNKFQEALFGIPVT